MLSVTFKFKYLNYYLSFLFIKIMRMCLGHRYKRGRSEQHVQLPAVH